MNKHEFKSAYSKIALSEEFKARAKQMLSEESQNSVIIPTDDMTDERPTKVMRLEAPKKKSPIKAIALAGSAAAVIGLAVFGANLLSNSNKIGTGSTTDSTAGTEVTETSQTEITESTDSEVEITAPIEAREPNETLSYPVELKAIEEGTASANQALPFDMDIWLPDGWELRLEDGMYQIFDGNNEPIAVCNYGPYSVDIKDTEANKKLGTHEPCRGAYSSIMLGSFVNWGEEYTVIKSDNDTCTATCRVMERGSDKEDYGILAHSNNLQVYVGIRFTGDPDPETLREIANSIQLHENNDRLAELIAQDFLTEYDRLSDETMLLELIDTKCFEWNGNRIIFVAQPDYKHTGFMTYVISRNRCVEKFYEVANSVSIYEYSLADTVALIFNREDLNGDVSYVTGHYCTVYCNNEPVQSVVLGYISHNGETVGWSSTENGVTSDITLEQYSAAQDRLLKDFNYAETIRFDSFIDHNHDTAIVKNVITSAFSTSKYCEYMKTTHLNDTDISDGTEKFVRISFEYPSSIEFSYEHVAYLDGNKIIEVGVPYPESEGISDYSDMRNGGELTIHEEKTGSEVSPYEHYIYASAPDKYASDMSYDAYWYTVNSGGYNLVISFIADAGMSKSRFEKILETVKIEEVDRSEIPDER